MARHAAADLFVDTWLYGAHSTATDALRGGVPVLTLRDRNFASRVATSLLMNVGLPELAVENARVFEETAARRIGRLGPGRLGPGRLGRRRHLGSLAVPQSKVRRSDRLSLEQLVSGALAVQHGGKFG